jgi:hypothetical protein
LHPAPVVIEIEPLPPVALTLMVVGDTVYEQEPAA